MHIRSQMSLNMGQIEQEHLELFALEFGKIAEYDFLYTLSSTNIDRSAPNLVEMYVIIRSQMSLNMDLIRPELWVICPWIRKFAMFDFVYTLASANIDQSIPNLATTYLPIRSGTSSIMEQIIPKHPDLFALDLEKLLKPTLFTLYHLQILTNQHPTWSKCMWP